MSPLLYPGSEQQKRDELRIAVNAKLRSSEEPAPETAGPVSSFALARGCLWVSSASLLELAAREEERAKTARTREHAAIMAGNISDARIWLARHSAYDAFAMKLRRLAEGATVRQPTDNIGSEQRARTEKNT